MYRVTLEFLISDKSFKEWLKRGLKLKKNYVFSINAYDMNFKAKIVKASIEKER